MLTHLSLDPYQLNEPLFQILTISLKDMHLKIFFENIANLVPFVFAVSVRGDNNTVFAVRVQQLMMTSSNGNIFRITGPLCG